MLVEEIKNVPSFITPEMKSDPKKNSVLTNQY